MYKAHLRSFLQSSPLIHNTPWGAISSEAQFWPRIEYMSIIWQTQ